MVKKSGMLREFMVTAMLQDEEAIGIEPGVFGPGSTQNYIGQHFQIGQSIRRIGKDEIITSLILFQKLEDIGMYRSPFIGSESLFQLFEILPMMEILLHTGHKPAATTCQFHADTARSGKEVERCGFVCEEIEKIVFEYIEEPLLGKVGSRSCLEVRRHRDTPVFIFTSYDSHLLTSFPALYVIISNVCKS